jgi:hypothetical protein
VLSKKVEYPMCKLVLGQYFIKKNYLLGTIVIKNKNNDILFAARRPFIQLKWCIDVYDKIINKKIIKILQKTSLIKKVFLITDENDFPIGYVNDLNILDLKKEVIGILKENKVYLNGLTGVRNIDIYDILIKDQKLGEFVRELSNKCDFILDYKLYPSNYFDHRFLIALAILIE